MRTTFSILAALTAVALTGCGGSSGADNKANDYALAVQQAQFRFANAFEKKTNELLKSTSSKKNATTLRAAAKVVDADVDELRGLSSSAPAAVKGLHKQLVTAMATYSLRLKKAAGLVAANQPRQFIRAKSVLTDASRRVSERVDTLVTQINNALS
jgi:hypothetical protein